MFEYRKINITECRDVDRGVHIRLKEGKRLSFDILYDPKAKLYYVRWDAIGNSFAASRIASEVPGNVDFWLCHLWEYTYPHYVEGGFTDDVYEKIKRVMLDLFEEVKE